MKKIWILTIFSVVISLFLVASSISCFPGGNTSNAAVGDINTLKSALEKDGTFQASVQWRGWVG